MVLCASSVVFTVRKQFFDDGLQIVEIGKIDHDLSLAATSHIHMHRLEP